MAEQLINNNTVTLTGHKPPNNNSMMPSSSNIIKKDAPQQQFNGVHSTQSSRGASPIATRFNQIPASQLPPSQQQLAARSTGGQSIASITSKTAQLSVVGGAGSHTYSTSTPNELSVLGGGINNPQVRGDDDKPKSGLINSVISPIITTNQSDSINNIVTTTPVKLSDVRRQAGVIIPAAIPKTLFDQNNLQSINLNQNSNNLPSQQQQQQQSGTSQYFISQPPTTNNQNVPLLVAPSSLSSNQIPLPSLLQHASNSNTNKPQSNNNFVPLSSQQQHIPSNTMNQSSGGSNYFASASSTNQFKPVLHSNKYPTTIQNSNNIPQQQQQVQNFNAVQQQPPQTILNHNQTVLNQQKPLPYLNQQPLNPQQSILNQKQPILSQQPPYLSQQQPILNQQSSYLNKQPVASLNQPQSIVSQQPPYLSQQQPILNQQSYLNQQPVASLSQPQSILNQKQSILNQQPPIFNQQPPYLNQQQSYVNQQQLKQPMLNQGLQYPQQQQINSYNNQQQPSVTQSGFNKLWGADNVDLLQNPNVLQSTKIEAPRIHLGQESLDSANCSPDIFRCTMTKIPESSSLLAKSRLPLGVLIHPFKDLTNLPVIQCNVIVRCRACRTYINPFVFFVDSKRWKCNLCYRINELPEEFQYDPVSKTYGDPSRRPEIRSSTIEYIAPAEYMLRPPQPAVYLFLLDISRLAIESGYLTCVCSVLLEELRNLPGDARTQIGIIAYDSALHFFALGDGLSQPHEMTVLDIDDIFLPCPDNLLVNLKDRKDLLIDLLTQLPTKYNNSFDSNSAMGAALQAAHKMMGPTGGRVTVFQASLPNIGPGALISREEPSMRASSDVIHLNPANDFYKRLALECSGQQMAVDLFLVNSQYVDLATISGISRFSGGCIHHFPLFNASKQLHSARLERTFRRYLTRKIGFEAVMRIRCTRGLSIHTFHGNFFVRSTDLLSLPNVNPDAGFGMQLSIDENLSDVQTICLQAALLYTSSKGERRIRVHTICLPIVANLQDVINSADQQCIVGLLAKMAVDRSMQSSMSDAREAFINVAIDILSSYKLSLNMGNGLSGLLAPQCLRLLPLYISAMLKYLAFRTGTSTRLDDRVKAMIDMKTKPLNQLIQLIYPDLYPVHNLEECPTILLNSDTNETVPSPPHLQLTSRCLDSNGAYLMDLGEHMILLVCPSVSSVFLNEALGVNDYNSIPLLDFNELPILINPHNQRLHEFVNYLSDDKPYMATLQVIKDNSPNRMEFFERLIEDRVENALSYHEFLQHLKSQVK